MIRSHKDPKDIEAKEKMQQCFLFSWNGFFNNASQLNHGMGLMCYGKFHIPHGRANAIVITNVIEYNSNVTDAAKNIGI